MDWFVPIRKYEGKPGVKSEEPTVQGKGLGWVGSWGEGDRSWLWE